MRVEVLALAGLLVGTTGHATAFAQARAQDAVHCGTDEIATGHISRTIDGRTLALDDGREVRLAAIEVPAGAAEALAALVADGKVVLKRAEVPSDRYGRALAYAVVERDGAERSVQADMVAQGHAWVGVRVGDRACAADLKAREKAARKAKLGLWGDPYYVMKEAENPSDILAQRGRFALVEGKVLSVRESGATIYVNFGRRWSEDFTVTILKRNQRNFTAAGLDPKRLAGRRVLVRGWIEERGGPWIEATEPGQIELADGD
jgi:endonuclease YncB( thermonuclease family)